MREGDPMGIFDWGKEKKPTITKAELKTKLMMSSRKLEKREKLLRSKEEKARQEAKKALEAGDERGFKKASRRFSLVHGQVEAITGMVDMSTTMCEMVEMQEGIEDIVKIGDDLKAYQSQLGINPMELESAITNIRTSMEKVTASSDMINLTMDSIAEGAETSELQEELRSELMAEITEEGVEEEELERKLLAEGM